MPRRTKAATSRLLNRTSLPIRTGRESFLLGGLVDHGLDTRRNATSSCTSMRGSLKTSSVGSGTRRLPTNGAIGLLIPIIFASCSERFSDVFITNSRRFRPAPATNLLPCATPRFPEHARGKRNPEGSSFRASSSRILARKVFADLARAGAIGDDACPQEEPGHTEFGSAE